MPCAQTSRNPSVRITVLVTSKGYVYVVRATTIEGQTRRYFSVHFGVVVVELIVNAEE